MGLLRNLSTPESREFWDSVDEAAKEVESWPPWKRNDNILADIQAKSSRFQIYLRNSTGKFGIYTVKKGVGKDNQCTKSEVAKRLNGWLKELKTPRWPMVTEAAKRICRYEAWMDGWKVVARIDLPEHRHMLICTLLKDKKYMAYYCPWEESDSFSAHTIIETKNIDALAEKVAEHILKTA